MTIKMCSVTVLSNSFKKKNASLIISCVHSHLSIHFKFSMIVVINKFCFLQYNQKNVDLIDMTLHSHY